ncbi:MAG: 50S ribosomal protein L5 [bacterium]|nr:50S ribosomal protein L5 [bacterium]
MAGTAELYKRYKEELIPALMKKRGYGNIMEVPRLVKVVLNIGLGEGKQDAKLLDSAVNELSLITGQRAVVTRARKSVAGFKIREGNPIGCKVTLRARKMYEFVSKLFNISIPRVRDFRGFSTKAFDGRGNFSLGLKEQLIFPEIEYDKVDRIKGMDVTLVTSARTDEEARDLLEMLGLPFRRDRA